MVIIVRESCRDKRWSVMTSRPHTRLWCRRCCSDHRERRPTSETCM